MTRRFLLTLLLVLVFAIAAVAGTISGTVSPGKVSVVYVDAIAGKTFPPPSAKPLMDQKGLMFTPHVLAIQQGTTVEFLNSDTVQHNVFWPSISGNKKLTGDRGNYKIDNVPDGKYNVVAWHEGMKPQTKSVDVAGAAKADFTLSK